MFFIGAFGIEYRLHLEIETEKEKNCEKWFFPSKRIFSNFGKVETCACEYFFSV